MTDLMSDLGGGTAEDGPGGPGGPGGGGMTGGESS